MAPSPEKEDAGGQQGWLRVWIGETTDGKALCGRSPKGIAGPRAQASGLVAWTTKGLPSQSDGSLKGLLERIRHSPIRVPAGLRKMEGTKC